MKILLGFLMGWLCVLNVAAAEKYLDVDDAFQLSVSREEGQLVVYFDAADGYYLYKDKYRLVPLENAKFGEAIFSDNEVVKYDPNFDEDMSVYYQYLQVQHPIKQDQGSVKIVYQGCADAGLCYPPQSRYFSLNGDPLEPPATTSSLLALDSLDGPIGGSIDGTTDSLSQVTFISAMMFAFIGGLILNLMPCVFPVLALKALQFAQMGTDRHHNRMHGIFYTLGVLVSFLVVASVLMGLRALGDLAGWGFQLQSPYFVAFLVLLFFVMSLSMLGVIEIGTQWMGVGQNWIRSEGLPSSFLTGVLATIVATPCTAPFMGSAIGFALAQPMQVGLIVFASMALGMAFPMLLLSFFPVLERVLPKPGAWMQTFRQLMAFPLFIAVLWLLSVLVELQGSQALLKGGVGLLLIALAMGSLLQGFSNAWVRQGVRGAVFVLGVFWVLDQRVEQSLWQPYSEQALTEALNADQAVFVDVTAAWCITCKANERVALSGNRFESLVEETDILLLKADWTKPSPMVDQLLARFERQGVPLYIYFPKGSTDAQILPQILTFGLIEETFRQ